MSFLLVLPFIFLLISIAVFPLLAPKFWESNKNKAIISGIFGIPVGFYIFFHEPEELWHTVTEYFSFISLLASLYIVSGGIFIRGDIKATPFNNSLILFCGAILSNFLGTTGASMLLIRFFLRVNLERKNTKHLPIFFIFLVSNIGGLLLPIGDPPLFLGFLKGVPFFWTLNLLPGWIFIVGGVLIVFYIVDRMQYKKETEYHKKLDEFLYQPIRIEGGINFLWLFGILLSVIFLKTPIREGVMWAMAFLSLATTPKIVREKNNFNYHAIEEVAVLFVGIFLSMIPCLILLREKGGELGIKEPWQFFWMTGVVSSFLDNAPTYLAFLSLAEGVTKEYSLNPFLILRENIVSVELLKAISYGAVFMGANTYIGNAPNFMVKAISENWKFKPPSFFGYMLWSYGILIPIFILFTVIFL